MVAVEPLSTTSTWTMTAEQRPVATQDFNQHVNGEFLATVKIPDDQTRWGSFMILNEENLARCREVCEAAPATSPIGATYRRASEFPAEVDPAIKAFFAEIDAKVTDLQSYLKFAAKLLQLGASPIVHIAKSEDAKNPNLRVPHVIQSGLGLPDKSYYTDRTDVHEAYVAYINDITALLGASNVDGAAVLELEKKIAEVHLDRAKMRDPDLVYNKREWSSLGLRDFFDSLELFGTTMSYCIVDNPVLIDALPGILGAVPVATLRSHLAFKLADHFAMSVTEQAYLRAFDFRGKLLGGQKSIQVAWKRAVKAVEKFLGDELGKLYVAAYFPESKRTECNAMIGDLKEALKLTLEGLEWMAPETKQQALRKLERFGVKVGVPKQWHSIEGLWADVDMTTASLATLTKEWYAWDWKEQEVKKFYTEPERELWHMTPQTVNAYYHPEMNEIVFPAGILQPPFFGFDTYEQNVGAIGVVIGHEMTHGFDDQGRKYNANGELSDWWTEADGKEFETRAAPVRDHYGSLLVQGKPVNGQLTLGENIADIGGLKLALRALRIHYGGKLPEGAAERFFEAYAGIWRMAVRPETELKLLAVDPHSPCHLRINAALGHIEEFYQTYDVRAGDGMFLEPSKRMQIW